MDVINIPRFSNWNTEYEVYSDLTKFINLCRTLCRSGDHKGNNATPVLVLRQLTTIHALPIDELHDCFLAVRDAAFAYTEPEVVPPNKEVPLFSEFSLSMWRNQNKVLKKLLQQHIGPVALLQHIQKKCWWSRDKVKQYAGMVEAAEISIQYYIDDEDEYNARKRALKGLKSDLVKRQKTHLKNVSSYQEILTEEHYIQQQIRDVAGRLQLSITRCLRDKINDAVTWLQQVCDPEKDSIVLDTDKISKRLYEVTSKKYVSTCTVVDMSCSQFNDAIMTPRLDDSCYDFGEYDATYATHNYYGTVLEDAKPDCRYPHELNIYKDDDVKLKLVSRDRMRGFGWTKPSKFSMKKWGFFDTSNILLSNVNVSSESF